MFATTHKTQIKKKTHLPTSFGFLSKTNGYLKVWFFLVGLLCKFGNFFFEFFYLILLNDGVNFLDFRLQR